MIIDEKKSISKKKWILMAVTAGIIFLVVFSVKSFYSFTEFEDDPSVTYITDRGYLPESDTDKAYPPEPTELQPDGAVAVINSTDKGYSTDPKTAAADLSSESRYGSSEDYSEETGYPPEV